MSKWKFIFSKWIGLHSTMILAKVSILACETLFTPFFKKDFGPLDTIWAKNGLSRNNLCLSITKAN